MKKLFIGLALFVTSIAAHAGDNGQNGRLVDATSLSLVQQLNNKQIGRVVLCYFDDAEDGGPKTWSVGKTKEEAVSNLITPDGSVYLGISPVCVDRVTSVATGEENSLRSVSF